MVPHKTYAIYRRKTKARRSGRPIYRYYYQLWDEEKRKYGPGNSTGCTSRTAAEIWLAKQLAQEQQSAPPVPEFAAGLFDEGSPYLDYRQQRGCMLSRNHPWHNFARSCMISCGSHAPKVQ